MKDLIVLTACKDAEYAMRGLLGRPHAMGIRPIEVDYRTHPLKDPGCLNTPDSILRSQSKRYHYALVLFDRDGCGEQDPTAAERLAEQVKCKLDAAGWDGRVQVVVIEPELEQWVWSDSPQVDTILGWSGRTPGLRPWLRERGFLAEGTSKAHPRKEAMDAALRAVGMQWSADLFLKLATAVSVNRCQEPSFLRLRRILTDWFSGGTP